MAEKKKRTLSETEQRIRARGKAYTALLRAEAKLKALDAATDERAKKRAALVEDVGRAQEEHYSYFEPGDGR